MTRLFTLLAAALLVVGCEQSPEESILGNWYDADQGVGLEFFKDGRFVFDDGIETATGSYRVLDDGRVRLRFFEDRPDLIPIVQFFSYKLEGNTLALTIPGGETIKMNRRSR